ncbi:MAG: bifunctional hydroxymethylpyrimidine kinase/phosphomethylpyrimidine kinase, partial [Rikenellaceae bacterium]
MLKKILTIAGSDSGAGAGIQADMKSIIACGGYSTTAIT